MYYNLNEEEKEKYKIYFEEDNFTFYVDSINGEDKLFKLVGKIVADEEVYDNFTIEICTTKQLNTFDEILCDDLEWYDIIM